MKVVILAGGMGTRLSEETSLLPKPMVKIGPYPIIWHIMKIFSHYGHREFVILCGYKGEVIKEYFCNYHTMHSDLTIDLARNQVTFHEQSVEDWTVTMIHTGRDTMTASRIKKAKRHIGSDRFLLTYGDGVSDVDLDAVVRSHIASGKHATLTAVQPAGRFGAVGIETDGAVATFDEKPRGDNAWINGGFFVLEPVIFDYIPEGDDVVWEQEPLRRLAGEGQLNAFKHHGFWKSMDTLKDKNDLNQMWLDGQAPWEV